jgi:Polyphosphate kinase 2 (PPK2)
LWPQYIDAYEDAMALTSTKRAPWYVIPANHKWFRNLAISQIIADRLDRMGLQLPPTRVDIADIRRKYHAAQREAKNDEKRRNKAGEKGK